MICSNQRCLSTFGEEEGVGLCPECIDKATDSNFQVCVCEYCGIIYSIRPKITKKEPDSIEGSCIFCAKEIKRREKE